ncbi:50S ribosomal protein L6 [Sinanaerobacter chloroacetimidivorans]|jgi:large subunit ribosomal protein L6|uniref:Large ribosomal subunit protein uL6 n=1 Tax=Sinanaerobacter chloroacetimidivorans TaxID=2818044 RepID=A0A8J7VY77_9FIRM|nr:50S ribosomal protein L6 [Sinanaerobacter chloroacetimidivorans]MBR0597239.1 50S ribosomal protein L6 [Sinanaerobacter chloroacetimidivorans]
MSRIGRLPVALPAGVQVTVSDSNLVTVKGPKGELQEQISKRIKLEIGEGVLNVTREADDKEARSAHGLSRTLINNMVTGVTQGYEKKLQLVGVGYKAEKKGNVLVMNLGYSHPIEMPDPDGIETEVKTPTEIIVKGINKAFVGNYAANVRKWRQPEPYKGKGIRYAGEVIRRKEGKTGGKKK